MFCFFFRCTGSGFSDFGSGVKAYNCTDLATKYSGYGDDATWFFQGFQFSNDKGKLSSLEGVYCCNMAGTEFGYREKNSPEWPTYMDAYLKEQNITSDDDSTFDTNEARGIKSINRGSLFSVQGFMYRNIRDWTPNGCNYKLSYNESCDYTTVITPDYEEIYIESLNGSGTIVYPEINTDEFTCDECGDNDICDIIGNEDNSNTTNPFHLKFSCDNIEFSEAIIDSYKKCTVYPVYPALFYDYDSVKHGEAVIDQLDDYYFAFGSCVIKLWHVFFIFIGFRVFVKYYLLISELIAHYLCHAIRTIPFAKVPLVIDRKKGKAINRGSNIVQNNNYNSAIANQSDYRFRSNSLTTSTQNAPVMSRAMLTHMNAPPSSDTHTNIKTNNEEYDI